MGGGRSVLAIGVESAALAVILVFAEIGQWHESGRGARRVLGNWFGKYVVGDRFAE